MRKKKSKNKLPVIEEDCAGCFAVQNNCCTILNEIIKGCPFKKEAEESEDE